MPQEQDALVESSANVESDSECLELESIKVCGLELPVLRRRTDYFAACAGDLPIKSTGLVLWECGVLLADYLGFARWLQKNDEHLKQRPWWMLHPPAAVVPSRFWSAPERGALLELGGGCGLVAAVLASLGAVVVCTDGDPAALRTAARNCAEARRRQHGDSKGNWGDVQMKKLSFGDAEAAKRLVRECGPFKFIVGSDLLYGEAAPPEQLIDTLAALATEPGTQDAEVVLAVKNRCADEVEVFCRLAGARGLWDVSLADEEDLPEGYDCTRSYYGSTDRPAYNIIHLVSKACRAPEQELAPPPAEVAGADEGRRDTAERAPCDVAVNAGGIVAVETSADDPPLKRFRVDHAAPACTAASAGTAAVPGDEVIAASPN